MTIQELLGTTQEVLTKIGHAGHKLDARTVRFYTYEGIIPKPSKHGRDNYYDGSHVKALVKLKLLQEEGVPIRSMKDRMTSDSLETEICKLVDDIVSPFETKQEEGEVKMIRKPRSRKHPMVPSIRRPRPQPKTPTLGWVGGEEVLKNEVTDSAEFSRIQPYITLGSAFAFVKGVPADIADSIHRLLYGQKSAGKVEKAVLFVDDTSLVLPGVKLTGRGVKGDGIRAIIPDKGVYEEGGVASIFMFDPEMANKSVNVSVAISGSVIDRSSVQLDDNGCAIMRVPTIAVGRYEVSIEGTTAKCSFEATRYELTPFTVKVEDVTKNGNSIQLTIEAETYGQPYDGTATATVGGVSKECKFHEGLAKAAFELGQSDDELSVVLVDKTDFNLMASAPLPGSKKSERTDTTISQMGRVVTASMIRTSDAIKERGLFFETGALTNTPITIESCVSDKVRLRLSQPVEDLVVAVRDPISGISIIKEIGRKKAGAIVSVGFDFPFAMVNVGAFVDGEAWEGTSIVTKPSKKKAIVGLDSDTLEPGAVATINLEAEGNASVLLKVSDRRIRAHYEPLSAIASSAKSWLAWAIGSRQTGLAKGLLHYNFLVRRSMLRSSDTLYGSSFGSRGLMGSSEVWTSGITQDYHAGAPVMASSFVPDENPVSCFYSVESNVTGQNKNHELLHNKGIVSSKTSAKQLEISNAELRMCLGDCAKEAIAIPEPMREESVDLVYCDLVSVNGKKSIKVKMPDGIGLYDVKAFFVSGTDWAEAEATIRVTKKAYIEPMMPKVVAEGDAASCRALLVGIEVGYHWVVKLNGHVVPHENKTVGSNNVAMTWKATPGSHEVVLYSRDGKVVDRVVRTVEAMGEELVLGQEMRILRKGESYSIVNDDAISVVVLPGMESETKKAVAVVTDFQYSCCEQTSAKLVSALLAVMIGDDSSKAKGYEGIIRGEARLKSMYTPNGFLYYPHGSINEWASKEATRRVSFLSSIAKDVKLPADARKAMDSLSTMASAVAKVHGASGDNKNDLSQSYFDNKPISDAEASVAFDSLNSDGYYSSKANAAYAVACLVRQGQLEKAIDGANRVTKAMMGTMGGGWHGTCESLAYMLMTHELTKAGIVPGANGNVTVDGEKMTVLEASALKDAETIKATSGAVAVRITRLQRIDLGKSNSNVGISVDLVCEDGTRAIKAGKRAKLKVRLTDSYTQGDVLCVVLPDCLSRVVGGAKAKKFQEDFSGKKEVEIDLVAHGKTTGSQSYAAVVRNMYDNKRLGSVGLVGVEVK